MILETAFGRVALVGLDDTSELHADERAHAATLSPHRAREWMGGRAALRQLVVTELPMLSDDRGAPHMPPGFVGSVSHKKDLAAALVADDDGWKVGVDLDLAAPPRADIAPRILTARELAALDDHTASPFGAAAREPSLARVRGRAVTLRFAIKEAIYKAVDPFLRRYVAFKEVELDFDPLRVSSELGLTIEAAWLEHDGHWLAIARARRP